MIDPKLNEIPVDPNDEIVSAGDSGSEVTGSAKRRGLSINDTVAGNANLSTGARGVDTSGVRSGAGAGAGMTMVAVGEAGESVAPQIMGGDRGSGTTPLGANDSATTGSNVPSPEAASDLDTATVSRRAYELWCERGCPEGSPEVDWHAALEEHRTSRGMITRSAGA